MWGGKIFVVVPVIEGDVSSTPGSAQEGEKSNYKIKKKHVNEIK